MGHGNRLLLVLGKREELPTYQVEVSHQTRFDSVPGHQKEPAVPAGLVDLRNDAGSSVGSAREQSGDVDNRDNGGHVDNLPPTYRCSSLPA